MALPTLYTPLLKPDSLRLLKLFPASDYSTSLTGSLSLTTLRECRDDLVNRYTAISYVWGDPAPTDTLILGDYEQRLRLTANLSMALRNIRHVSSTLTLWVDAVCINQTDLPERAQQVRMMGEIYAGAGSTIIYLGLPKPGVDALFKMANDIIDGSLRLKQNTGGSTGVEEDAERSCGEDSTLKSVLGKKDGGLQQARIQGQEAFCSYEWFRRSWVLQELVLSNDPRVQCGQTRARWTDLLDVINGSLEGCDGTVRALSKPLPLTMNDARRLDNYESRTMANLIRARAGSHATDPRDFFFSLMGLMSDGDRVRCYFQIDYHSSVQYIYTAAAIYCLETMSVEELLDANAASLPSSEPWSPLKLCLPGWVPDWALRTPWKPDVMDHAMQNLEILPESSSDSVLPNGRLVVLRVEEEEKAKGRRIERVSSVLPLANTYPRPKPFELSDNGGMSIEQKYLWDGWIQPLWCHVTGLDVYSKDSMGEKEQFTDWLMRRSTDTGNGDDHLYRLALLTDGSLHMVPSSAAVGDAVFWVVALRGVGKTPQGITYWDGLGIDKRHNNFQSRDGTGIRYFIGRPLDVDEKEEDERVLHHVRKIMWNQLGYRRGRVMKDMRENLYRCLVNVQHFKFLGVSRAKRGLYINTLSNFYPVNGVAVIH